MRHFLVVLLWPSARAINAANGWHPVHAQRVGLVTRASQPLCRVVHYTREDGDNAPVDVAKVEEMLFQRSQLRQDRNFQKADEIYSELGRMGVTVFDREMVWFVGSGSRSGSGGRRGGGGSGGYQDGYQRRVGNRRLSYTREVGDHYPVDVEAVEALIEERTALRLSREFDGADRLRKQLQEEHGVYLQDKELKWYVGRGARAQDRQPHGEPSRDRRRSEYSPGEDDRAARYEARYEARYDPDRTQAERRLMGKRERQAGAQAGKATPYERASYDRAMLDETQVAEAQALIDERLRAKLDRKFDRADELLAEIVARGLTISDDQRLWRADGVRFDVLEYHEEGRAEGGRVGGWAGGGRAGETPKWIADAIRRRGEARLAKQYDLADEIMASLEAEGVGLDDARRTWRYLPLPPGESGVGSQLSSDGWADGSDDGW